MVHPYTKTVEDGPECNDGVGRRRWLLRGSALAAACALSSALQAGEAPARRESKAASDDAFDEDAIIQDIRRFFGETTEGLGDLIARLFKELGRPNGHVRGEEVAGAIGVGLRYGNGVLTLRSGASRKVYWQGPSVGFDLGGNASKVYVLVYNLKSADAIFQRFPSVDGSAYYVGGVGVNYQRRDGITLAPIRLGVGLRTGASIGYMHYTRQKTLNPL